MRRVIAGILGATCVVATGCGKDVYKVPEGRPGSMNVGGAIRARSEHYQVIGTLSPVGGAHASPSHRLNDGVFANQVK